MTKAANAAIGRWEWWRRRTATATTAAVTSKAYSTETMGVHASDRLHGVMWRVSRNAVEQTPLKTITVHTGSRVSAYKTAATTV